MFICAICLTKSENKGGNCNCVPQSLVVPYEQFQQGVNWDMLKQELVSLQKLVDDGHPTAAYCEGKISRAKKLLEENGIA